MVCINGLSSTGDLLFNSQNSKQCFLIVPHFFQNLIQRWMAVKSRYKAQENPIGQSQRQIERHFTIRPFQVIAESECMAGYQERFKWIGYKRLKDYVARLSQRLQMHCYGRLARFIMSAGRFQKCALRRKQNFGVLFRSTPRRSFLPKPVFFGSKLEADSAFRNLENNFVIGQCAGRHNLGICQPKN